MKFFVLVLAVVLVGCSANQSQQSTVVAEPTLQAAVPTGVPSVAPTAAPEPTLAPEPTVAPTAVPEPTAVPTAAPTADPYAEYEQYTIEGLRNRSYGQGAIEIVRTLSETPDFTRALFAYQSDGLRITGQLTRPRGEGPFPVIVLAHGYSPLATYTPGYDTQAASDYFAARGFLCLAPDFRSHAGSAKAPNTFRAGHVIDTLNLLPLISTLPDAKPGKVGMWGHSNGGEITTKVMEISDQLAAALIYSPASPELADNYYAFHAGDTVGDPSNTADFPLTPEQAPDLFKRMSPINYLQYTQVPVQIHHGTADPTVPLEWVNMLNDGLVAAGKQPELFLYEGGGHSLQGQAKQLYLERAVDFFSTNIR